MFEIKYRKFIFIFCRLEFVRRENERRIRREEKKQWENRRE